MGGLFALCAYLRFGFTVEGLVYYAFTATLLVITFIDIDHQIIPDRITLPGIPVFFLASLLLPATTLIDSLLGLLVGAGTLLVIGLTHKEGMGGGDIKLLAMIGVLLGWKGVFFTIFLASGVGTFAGIIAMLHQGKGLKLAIPFGPFLSIGAISYIFFGSKLIYWYFNLLG
jgi:leader peptidase (prepilin peptidase)/N-methyltransferase